MYLWVFTIKCNGVYFNRIYFHLMNTVLILLSFFLWVNAVQHFASATSADLFEVIDCLHTSHIFPYPGHHCDRWNEPQNLHLSLMAIVVCSYGCISFCLCPLFLANILSKFLFYLSFIGWLIVPFMPELFLSMPGLAHLSHYHFLLFWGTPLLFLYSHHCHSAHVHTTLLAAYEFPCSYSLLWLFYT